MGFYGSNDPTNSVKALKEDVQGLGAKGIQYETVYVWIASVTI